MKPRQVCFADFSFFITCLTLSDIEISGELYTIRITDMTVPGQSGRAYTIKITEMTVPGHSGRALYYQNY